LVLSLAGEIWGRGSEGCNRMSIEILVEGRLVSFALKIGGGQMCSGSCKDLNSYIEAEVEGALVLCM
jgi:hypothetical protein